MSPSADDVALLALTEGVGPVNRADFRPGEARPVAIDVLDDVAAVLVVRRRRDQAWILDVVRCASRNGAWTALGSSGGTYGDLPLEWHPDAAPEISVVTSGTWYDDERAFAYAGGFITGPVREVEIVSPIGSRRVRPGHRPPAFAVVVPTSADDSDRRFAFDEPDPVSVRALDVSGDVVDDTDSWRAERDASVAGTLTVADALRVPAGTAVTVRGVLLVLAGQPALICDEIGEGVPPGPLGPRLVLPGPAGPPSWKPGSAGTILNTIVASGVVRDGALVQEDPGTDPDTEGT